MNCSIIHVKFLDLSSVLIDRNSIFLSLDLVIIKSGSFLELQTNTLYEISRRSRIANSLFFPGFLFSCESC